MINLLQYAVARQHVLFHAAANNATEQQTQRMLRVTKRAIELGHNGMRAMEFGKAALSTPNIVVFPFNKRLNKTHMTFVPVGPDAA